MVYTVGEMAKRLGVAPSTLRFYDKEGLLPFVERSNGGVRVFKEADYEWLMIIECLKKTGMPLRDIKVFIEMAIEGDDTIDKRLALISNQKASIERQIAELSEIQKFWNSRSGTIPPPRKAARPAFRETCRSTSSPRSIGRSDSSCVETN